MNEQMQENQKSYGFTITLYEFSKTIETLWEVTQEFARLHPQYLHPQSALAFIVKDPRAGVEGVYNLCHFWSNVRTCSLKPRIPSYHSSNLNFEISSRLETYAFGVQKPIKPTLTSSITRVVSTMRDGAMRRSIRSQLPCSYLRRQSTNLMISPIDMHHLFIVQPTFQDFIRMENVFAIQVKALTRTLIAV